MTDIIPLTDFSKRFPKPETQSDILMTYPIGALSREKIFLFLTDPYSEHWRHRYDWKDYMRIQTVNGWVFKTSEWHCAEKLQTVEKKIMVWKERSKKINIWHPNKFWFILHHGDRYWACNATPRLITLPEIDNSYSEIPGFHYLRYKAERTWMFFWTLCRFRFLLDFKEGNFAVDQASGRLYYIDDELYIFDSWRDILSWRQQLLS